MSARWSRQRLDIQPGDKFGQWEVVREVERNSRGGRRFLCRCTCEKRTERPVFIGSLRSGQSRSCGCAPPHARLQLTEVKWRFAAELERLIKAHGLRGIDVARAMKATPNTVYNYIHNLNGGGPMPPIIDQFVTAIGATEEERRELHLAAARDRGYRV